MRTCTAEEGCDRKMHARGLCEKHYRRLWTSGTPMPNLPALPYHMTATEIREVSDLADAACPRFILIAHPNFKLPEGHHLGTAAHDKHGRRPA